MPFKSFTPEELTPKQRHHYILGTINPRPICFASTLDLAGNPNLAPYSFFNVFSSTPPILIFSVNTRRDGSLKDTLVNARDTGEVVINLVNYPIARQMAICGIEYDSEINEFEKGGFTPIPSKVVKPFRVKESPVQFECKVLEIKSLTNQPGAANLIIAQAMLIHADENIFAPDDTIDPHKLDMVGRLGNFNYCRAYSDSVFAIRQPPGEIAPGFDNLPQPIRSSKVLSGHYLAMLAGVVAIPTPEEVEQFANNTVPKDFLNFTEFPDTKHETQIHQKVKEYLENGETENAWLLILSVYHNPKK